MIGFVKVNYCFFSKSRDLGGIITQKTLDILFHFLFYTTFEFNIGAVRSKLFQSLISCFDLSKPDPLNDNELWSAREIKNCVEILTK